MKTSLFLPLLFTILVSSCKKDDNPVPPQTIQKCTATDEPQSKKIFSSLSSAGHAKLDVFPNGMAAVLSYDTVKIYDEDLQVVQTIFEPQTGGIVSLKDNTVLLVSYQKNQSSNWVGSGIQAYYEIGRGGNCEKIYTLTSQDSLNRRSYAPKTTIKRYNLQGQLLSTTSLDGLPVNEDVSRSFVAQQNHVYAALVHRDSVVQQLVWKNGVFQDTIESNSDEMEVNLYQMKLDGSIEYKKAYGNFISTGIFALRNEFSLFTKSHDYLWFNSGYEMAQFDLAGNLIHKSPNAKGQCGERIYSITGAEYGVYIDSYTPSDNKRNFYFMDGNGNLRDDVSSAWNGALIDETNGELSFLAPNRRIIINRPDGTNIRDFGLSDLNILEHQIKRACNGSFYAIANKIFSQDYFLVKISSEGDLQL